MSQYRAPAFVYIRLLESCELPCRIGIGCPCPHAFPGTRRTSLQTSQWCEIISGLARNGTRLLYITDGNPLRYPDLWSLVRHASRHGLRIRLSLPPELVDERVCQEVQSGQLDAVQVRLGSVEPRAHDALRWEGASQSAWAGVARLAEAGVPVHVLTPVLTLNAQRLSVLYQAVADLNLCELVLFRPLSPGFLPGQVDSFIPSPSDYLVAVMAVFAQAGKTPILKLADPVFGRSQSGLMQQLARVLDHDPAKAEGCLGGCLAGIDILFVDYDGTLYPCRYLPHPIGSVADGHFLSNPSLGDLDRKWRSRLHGDCGGCVVRSVCGGCRAQAWLVSRSVLDTDPWCSAMYGAPVTTIQER